MKKQKTTIQPAPIFLQRVFVYCVAGAVAVTFAQQIMFAVIQFQHNPNLSSFYITFLGLGLFPLVTFLMAYVLVSRKLLQWQRIFESMLVTVSAFAAQMAAYAIVANIFWSLKIADGDLFGSFGIPTITTVLIFLVTLVYLLILKKIGRW